MSFIHEGTLAIAKSACYRLKVNPLSLCPEVLALTVSYRVATLYREHLAADGKPPPATEKQRGDGFESCVVC